MENKTTYFKQCPNCKNTQYFKNKYFLIRSIKYNQICKSCARTKLNSKYGCCGLEKNRTWRIYYNMIKRCYNKKCREYQHYGARGIKVCVRWYGHFDVFVQDMNLCPDKLSIDRINNDGDYKPSNCRWTDCKTQNNNKQKSKSR